MRQQGKRKRTSARAKNSAGCFPKTGPASRQARELRPVPGLPGQDGEAVNGRDLRAEPAPGDAKAYYNRALASQKKGDCQGAISDYDRAIALDPGLAWAYYHRGLAYGDQGDRRQQVKDLETAARLGLRLAVDILATRQSREMTGPPEGFAVPRVPKNRRSR